jgi:SAM-dependent methyltransferase
LRDRSADGAWLSAVVHHFRSLDQAAAELMRVLRDGGIILIRGFFRDVEVAWHFAHFPGIDRGIARLPSASDVVAALTAQGAELIEQVDVTEHHELTPDWEDRLRAQRKADSLLRPLSDAEFVAGLDSLRSSIAGDVVSVPVTLRLIACCASRRRGE